MKKYLLLLFLFIGFSIYGLAQSASLENLLFELPDVIFKEIEPVGSYEKAYELQVKQLIDHNDSSKGYFYQRAYLSHKGFDCPTVIVTQGYTVRQNRISELAGFLNANQLDVEHRYFGESCPDSLDYTYLNLEQATADLHHINQLFKEIYKGKWLSTGASKGGATTIFYRYFYPNDVDVSVPYVAPINREREDSRIYEFLDTVGSKECHAKIRAFQRRMLKEENKVLPLVEMYANGARLSFTYMTIQEAYEYTVMEYPFAFWQYGKPCDEIPGHKAPISDALDYLIKISDLFLFSDKGIDTYLSHYYQAASEMGYYGYRTENFKGLLKTLPTDHHPYAALVPDCIPVHFDGKVLKGVNEWLKTDANKMIYLYGALDTWSSTGVPPNDKVDAVWFYMKGKDHATANIKNMTPEEKQKFVSTLERWLGMTINE